MEDRAGVRDGVGLGLSIARSVVTAHHATVNARSQPAGGLEISVVIPRGDARILKALADPTRPRLVSMVAAHQAGEACVCDLTEPLGLTQPTISHHLKILVDAGIFTRDQRGKWAYYALVPRALDAVSAVLRTSASTRDLVIGLVNGTGGDVGRQVGISAADRAVRAASDDVKRE